MPKKVVWSIVALSLGFVCIVFVAEKAGFYLFRAKYYSTPAGSMLPTLDVDDQFLARQVFSILGEEYTPIRGEIIVFWNQKSGADYVKRLIGLPGERIRIQEGVVYIDGVALKRVQTDDFVAENGHDGELRVRKYSESMPNGALYEVLDVDENGWLDNTDEYVVPAGHLFVMGDNRDNSVDSRVASMTGFVPIENVKGVAKHVYFSGPEKRLVWRPVAPLKQ